ncbi:hypothetical protein [Microbacterium capsulatum]|uniref:Uncharacterized protein n=1 Tax=Microbacterium capsulatum TaxID=3041921 RepID=A0ABU0XJ65_9MICO|nr:hypothetical protein [Microbacterium sp. ASV81]MDQ4213725.1 hypothetical protein [Microbacterium sp. ASV81]
MVQIVANGIVGVLLVVSGLLAFKFRKRIAHSQVNVFRAKFGRQVGDIVERAGVLFWVIVIASIAILMGIYAVCVSVVGMIAGWQ